MTQTPSRRLPSRRLPFQDVVISPVTRWVAAFLVPFLLTAGFVLTLWPGRTTEMFAWPVKPPLTALLMGAGYLSGAYFFLRVIRASLWHSVQLGFLPISVFALLAAIATGLHWEKFSHDNISFIAWAGLYAITPFIVPALWFSNRKNGDHQPEIGIRIPVGVAASLAAAGSIILVTGAALFLVPAAMISRWPWLVTPLTARILGSFFILTGLVDWGIALNRRWEAVRIVAESQLVGLALILLAIPRDRVSLNWESPASGIFIAGMALLFAWLVFVYLRMEQRSVGASKTD